MSCRSRRTRDPFTPLGSGEDGHAYAAVAGLTFFPRAAHEQLPGTWPHLPENVGADWDEHRDHVERGLVTVTADGIYGGTTTGEFAEFAAYVQEQGVRRPDQQTLTAYSPVSKPAYDVVAWPPDRGEPCGCGSDVKYKRCCRPRGMGSFA